MEGHETPQGLGRSEMRVKGSVLDWRLLFTEKEAGDNLDCERQSSPH